MIGIVQLLCGWGFASALMVGMYLYQRRTGDPGIVDVAWAAGVGLLGCGYALLADGNVYRRGLVAIVVVVWAGRLGLYILNRVRSMPEDGRYVSLKEKWGTDADRKMFWFFQFQAVAVMLFALPIFLAAGNPQPLHWLDGLGVLVGVIAILGESTADRQLHQFRKEPGQKGKVCQVGWWRYSRHPNYFFEWLHWWAYVFLAITYPWGWLTLLGPGFMWYFINFVTGIPPTEAQALKSRGEAYRNYQKTTNAFFPGPRRRAIDGRESGEIPSSSQKGVIQ